MKHLSKAKREYTQPIYDIVEVSTSRAIAFSDVGKILNLTAEVDITIPPEVSVNFPLNCRIDFIQSSNHTSTFLEGSGVTIESADELTLPPYFEGYLQKIGADIWTYNLKVSNTLFGSDPASLDGVDFFDGTATKGMIVFKTAGTYSITANKNADVEALVVAGGGGGGGHAGGGGGGAGGLLYDETLSISKGSITVTVGAGGNGGLEDVPNRDGFNGGNSVFSTLTSIGGGKGGKVADVGGDGGSGGGHGGGSGSQGIGGLGTVGQGNNGGPNLATTYGGGGGGGQSEVGTGAGNGGGDGGDGIAKFGFSYAGGGGGGTHRDYANGAGGIGGGGAGGQYAAQPVADGIAGTANTGGGGGGAGGREGINPGKGGNGAKGIVIIRWGGYNKNYNPTTNAVW